MNGDRILKQENTNMGKKNAHWLQKFFCFKNYACLLFLFSQKNREELLLH